MDLGEDGRQRLSTSAFMSGCQNSLDDIIRLIANVEVDFEFKYDYEVNNTEKP